MNGKLYLIPTTLGESPIENVIPKHIIDITRKLLFFIVENERTARRYLKRLDREINIDNLTFYVLNKHTSLTEILEFLTPAINGNDIGLISEAGVPGVADPGAEIVSIAHQKQIKTIPLVGPSSILLSLMASGLNGQSFAFNGYLPIKPTERISELKRLESIAKKNNQTQIFIETPYRNMQILSDITNNCAKHTQLCIAADITLETEFIETKTIGEWKNNLPSINKRPAIFLIL